MNEIVNKFLLVGDKEEYKQKFKETGNSRYICQMELDKACFQCDIAYGDFKDFPWRRASDKSPLCNKAFNFSKSKKIWWISKRSCFNVL